MPVTICKEVAGSMAGDSSEALGRDLEVDRGCSQWEMSLIENLDKSFVWSPWPFTS